MRPSPRRLPLTRAAPGGVQHREAAGRDDRLGTGEQRRDFTHVNDIVSGLIAMSQKDWKATVFNLGTGRNHSINELADMFKTEKTCIPGRPGEAKTTKADLTLSKHWLNYEPTVKLEDYINDLLDH